MKIFAELVEGLSRSSIPEKGTTVLDDMDINVPFIAFVDIYRRNKEDCPFNRGNWICDITFKDGELVCLKLPLEMPETDLLIYFKPIISHLKSHDMRKH